MPWHVPWVRKTSFLKNFPEDKNEEKNSEQNTKSIVKKYNLYVFMCSLPNGKIMSTMQDLLLYGRQILPKII